MASRPKDDWVLLGKGKSSHVFRIGGGQIIKVFHAAVSEEMIQREMAAATLAAAHDLPTAAPARRTAVDGLPALIYPEVTGTPLAATIRKYPYRASALLGEMAELLAAIHDRRVSGLRTVNSVIETDINYGPAPAALKQAACAYLATLPLPDHLLHGDFHIDNIIIRDGRPVILDWAKAAIGHPAADMVRAEMLMRFGEGPADPVTALWRDWAAGRLGRAYRQHSGLHREQLSLWRPVVALAWLRARPSVRDRAFHAYLNRALARAGLPRFVPV
ncbi:phosphotransferase family protein [Sphingobium quisquiliarum]|uniref:phosphotransferase family protein n=1 Tax=Sphingobium quisquiliarum TaxID=538379 RepID=UPI000687FC53|nr:phosphotransferase [Sphingobium quisquiliarum]